MRPEETYRGMTSAWLERMRLVKASQRDFYEGLKAALEEVEIEIQACKETMPSTEEEALEVMGAGQPLVKMREVKRG